MPGERIGILASTSLTWELAQMAALRIGACVAGIDVNYTDTQLAAVLEPLCLTGLIVEDGTAANRIPPAVRTRLKFTLSMQEIGCDSSFAEASDSSILGAMAEVSLPDDKDDAVIVFSSGTTGIPKAICYRHGQLMAAVQAVLGRFPDIRQDAVLVCWLPLANLFQRMINFCAIARGAASYLVSDPRTVMECLPAANPHLFIGVPRFFEKIQASVNTRIAHQPRIVSALTRYALAIGHDRAAILRDGGRPPLSMRMLWPIADCLVLRRVRRIFGRNLRYCISGSAPMPRWLLEWFDAIGLPVLEAYGISENIVPMAICQPCSRKLGSVGQPLPGNAIRLAEDGEIMVRGPGVFSGYMGAADTSLKRDPVAGFHATGDLGKFDEQGFLYLIGRKADVFKTSTGRWIVPAGIEERLRRLPYIEQALVFGANRKAVIVLICLTQDHMAASGGKEVTADMLAQDFERVLNDVARYQRPAAALIIDKGFSIAGGEVTSNLKLRRKNIEANYGEQIDRLYARTENLRSTGAGTAFLIVEHA